MNCQYKGCTKSAVATIADGTNLCAFHLVEIRVHEGVSNDIPSQRDEVAVKNFYKQIKKETQ